MRAPDSKHSSPLLPKRGLWEERPHQKERDCRDQSGKQRVSPCFMAAPYERKPVFKGYGQVIGGGDHHPAHGLEGLRVSENGLALPGARKQLCEPCDGGDKLYTGADESGAAQQEQLRQGRGKTCGTCGSAVEEDA